MTREELEARLAASRERARIINAQRINAMTYATLTPVVDRIHAGTVTAEFLRAAREQMVAARSYWCR